MDVVVKGSGFKIFSSNLKTKPIILNIDNLGKKTNLKYYLLPKNQQVEIQKQLVSGLKIEQLLKDTIYLEIGNLTSKKVPVRPDLNIKYQIGYDASGFIEVAPDSILISGSEEKINSISSLQTNLLNLEGVKSDFENTVSIIKPKNSKNINFSHKTVQIKGSVEKFTEGTFEVVYKVINLPSNVQLNTLTRKVEVVFVVALSNFNKIDANSFKVECDYLISSENNLGYLIPKIVSKPGLVKSVKVVPNKIDFLIQK